MGIFTPENGKIVGHLHSTKSKTVAAGVWFCPDWFCRNIALRVQGLRGVQEICEELERDADDWIEISV